MSYPGIVVKKDYSENVIDFCNLELIKFKIINESERKVEFLFTSSDDKEKVSKYVFKLKKLHASTKFRCGLDEDIYANA